MKTIQEVFEQLTRAKKESKIQKGVYKSALENSDNYRKVTEELKALREKKKQIETVIKKDLGEQYTKIEDLNLEVKNTQEMLDDVALIALVKSQKVEAQDEYGNKYGPEFRVKFKKDFQPTLGI